MSPSPLRASSWLVLCLLLVGSPLRSALAADDFQRYLAAAVQLYENLEYERALAQVQRARTVARGVEQDVSLGLHEGIFLAEMGRWDEARTSFETALLLEPTAKLPLSVSPKVERHFESIRQSVNAAIARRKQGATPGTPAPTSTEAKPAEQKPVAEAKPAEQKPVAEAKPAEQKPVVVSEARVEQKQVVIPKPPEQKPVVESDRPEQAPSARLVPPEPSPALNPHMEASPSSARVVSVMLLGTSVVTGSLGAYFALRPDPGGLRSQGDQSTANTLFVTSGLALVGAAVSWAVSQVGTSAESAPVDESSDP
ncbi:hypothetical protein [Archangium lipolyticum]|uniref:hypothetical protein n=1 Tax=Archangium lipolyticum TaxID=2970465 RepID=UPI00214A622A|nr:hypothetical protein [Archangium lipolyticum]